ncbi:MAG TPA: hypothetical protein VF698_08060 [Thermoanaerobaculia bacterium]|jgi:ElaB/YqjD/DUF883 family membrane-anchored ribosome-binding protein
MADETTGTGTGADQGNEGAHGRFDRAREFASGAYERASGAYERATGAARNGYNAARERYEDVDVGAVADQVRTYVRSNPGKALLVSVGVGFLIGLLLRRDEDDA